MKSRVFAGGVIVAGVVAGAAGCMPESLEVGRAVIEADAGASGEGDGGMSSGVGGSPLGGTGGHSGSSSAGRTAAGGRNGEGKGGAGTTSAGDGGSSRGGTGGGGASGDAGNAGDPRISFDPACDCTAVIDDDWGEFSCAVPLALFDAHFDPPESCDLDETHAQRWSCGDGTEHYDWMVGGENDYAMVFDGETLVYGTAFGFDLAQVCDFSYTDPKINGQTGSLRAGSEPEADCYPACAICETGDTDLPRCADCVWVPDAHRTVTEPLEEYCVDRYCPRTLAEARGDLATQCGPPSPWTWLLIRSGCGLVRVEHSDGISGSAYYYDEASETLVGARVFTDVPWGECKAYAYQGGNVPVEACSETTTCDICKPQDGGAAGAGGEGGTGGASSVYEACPP